MTQPHPKNLVGFTLIELLVSLAIIALVTGVFLANYHGGENKSGLLNVRDDLIKDLRIVRANSLGHVKYNNLGITDGFYNWGMKIDKPNNSYTIFADLNNSLTYSNGEANPNYGGRVVALPKNVVITSLSATRSDIIPLKELNAEPGNGEASGQVANIIMPLPIMPISDGSTMVSFPDDPNCNNPGVICCTTDSPCDNLTIVLKDTIDNATSSVTIDSNGSAWAP